MDAVFNPFLLKALKDLQFFNKYKKKSFQIN